MGGDLEQLGAYIADSVGSGVGSYEVQFGDLIIHAARSEILSVLKFLRDDEKCRFVNFIDICGVDYPDRAERFDVVYHLLSPYKNTRVRIKIQASQSTPVPSAIDLFPAANWFEREAYDMYGILFSGHPDLRRMLTDYGFVGHPLQKDFPVTGHVEVRYDDELKRVVYEPVKLAQAFRRFDFESPWEGMGHVLPGDEKATKEGEGQ